MKKIFASKMNVIVIIMVFCLFAVASAADVQKDLRESSTIEKVIRSGKLRVGMSTFIPWAMQSKTGEWIGFEIDVAKKLAEDMEVEVEFVPTKWEGLIPGLLTGKFDLIIAGMTGTPTRALKINFTVPYDFSEMNIVAHKEVAAGFKTAEDFNNPEVTVLTRNGTTAVAAVKKFLPEAQLRLFSENGPMVQELLNGKAHAIVTEFEGRLRNVIPDLERLVTHIEPAHVHEDAPLYQQETHIIALAALRIAQQLYPNNVWHDLDIRAEADGGFAVSVHCRVADDMPLEDAHRLAEQVETQVRARLPEIHRVTIHTEPLGG